MAKKGKGKKIGRVAAAILSGGASEAARAAGKTKLGSKIKDSVKKNASKIKEGAKLIALLHLFGPMAPLAAIFLKRRGIQPAKGIKEKIVQVFNESKKKSFGLVTGGDVFDYGGTGDEEGPYEYGMVPITPGMITAVLSFLKGIFAKIKEKKQKGEALSPDEQAIADQAPAIEKGLDEAKAKATEVAEQGEAKAKELEAKAAAGGMSKQMKIGLAVLILIVLAFLFMRK